MDNFTIITNSPDTANHLIHEKLTERFEVSDLGPSNWLLGVSISWNLESFTSTFLSPLESIWTPVDSTPLHSTPVISTQNVCLKRTIYGMHLGVEIWLEAVEKGCIGRQMHSILDL